MNFHAASCTDTTMAHSAKNSSGMQLMPDLSESIVDHGCAIAVRQRKKRGGEGNCVQYVHRQGLTATLLTPTERASDRPAPGLVCDFAEEDEPHSSAPAEGLPIVLRGECACDRSVTPSEGPTRPPVG